MGAWHVLGLVLGAIALIILLGWLAGCCRSRKTRPSRRLHEEESELEAARRRYEAGEMSDSEFQEARQKAASHGR